MLNSIDSDTVISLRLLRKTIASRTKPIIFWVGAGASVWNGYPTWIQLARNLRREFYTLKSPSDFDNGVALNRIDSDLPSFFQMCKDLDSALYFRFLSQALAPRPCSTIYERFLSQIRKTAPVQIVTTNVDETLEQSLGPIEVVQRSDFSRSLELIQSSTPFVAKLHGSRSAAETMVFTTQDYAGLLRDSPYMNSINVLFACSSVIFLGYGVRDQYTINVLLKNAANYPLFGAGPHFVVTADSTRIIGNVHRIAYDDRKHADHRAALTVLDCICQSRNLDSYQQLPNKGESGFKAIEDMLLKAVRPTDPNLAITQQSANFTSLPNSAVQGHPKPEGEPRVAQTEKTGYYISDFRTPGTWHTHESAEFKFQDGIAARMTVGLGFTNDELPTSESTAMHDFTVGLICFDRIYLTLASLAPLFNVIGETLLLELLEADSLWFLHIVHLPAVIYKPEEIFGGLTMVLLGGSPGKKLDVQPDEWIDEMSVRELLSRQVSSVIGKEAQAEQTIGRIEERTRLFKYATRSEIGSELTDALLMPGVSRLLGISEAMMPTNVPLWLMFPYLRMAHLVHTGAICSKLDIQAAKIPFGGTQLVSAAFGIQPATEWAERVASYGVTGRFDTNLGALIIQQPQLLRKILLFRKSSEGESFRRGIRQTLMHEPGAEFTASVNAGIERNLPSSILQRGHDKFQLLMTENSRFTPVPVVWGDLLHSDNSTQLWRRKALRTLTQMCDERGIKKEDPCICGSGDKLRLCCMHPLVS